MHCAVTVVYVSSMSDFHVPGQFIVWRELAGMHMIAVDDGMHIALISVETWTPCVAEVLFKLPLSSFVKRRMALEPPFGISRVTLRSTVCLTVLACSTVDVRV